jgi:alpha-ketoglutarate-dependent 2,4-dichlorophenoxyacetate dioxygenase
MTFSVQFGPLEAFPEQDKTKGKIEVYNVANVSPEGEHLAVEDPRVIFQRNNARWHTDSSYRFEPSLASILYGIEVLPEGAEGGETGFSNMLLAYEALPDDMKRRLEPLHQVHNYEGIRRLEPTMPPTSQVERDAFPPVTHPLIRVHPDRGGRRSLYFTCNTSREIGGGTLDEGQKLHEWLREWVDQPRFCYYHRWRVFDLVMWDNRVLLHRAIPYDYAKYRRVLRRTTVAGRGPVMGPFSARTS